MIWCGLSSWQLPTIFLAPTSDHTELAEKSAFGLIWPSTMESCPPQRWGGLQGIFQGRSNGLHKPRTCTNAEADG